MRSRSIFSTLVVLLANVHAQETGSINTATITDATAVPETPTTVPTATTSVSSDNTLQTTISNPVTATAPGAQITTTAGAPTVTTSALTTDNIVPTAVAAVAAQDLFVQIASDNPAAVLNGNYVHPVTPININANYLGSSGSPIETNNFYGNLLVGDGTSAAYAMPYTVFWKQGSGLCAWNTDSTKYVFGSYSSESTPGPHYYYSGAGNCPIGLSSAEMGTSQTMTTSNLGHQSVDITFSPGTGSGSMTIPLVQGTAFLTSIYTGLTPQLFGGAFTSLTGVTFKAGTGATAGVSKYRITINNGDTWLAYVFANNGGASTLTLSGTTLITGPSGFSGVLQIAKLPLNYASTDEATYDAAAGTYATQNVISGTASGDSATYTFDFAPTSLAGNPLLSFLFPHQIASVSSGTATSLKLWSNTKGQMQAFTGNTLAFTESDLPTDIQFLPWSPVGNLQNYSAPALQAIAAAANAEAAQVMSQQTELNSMYYSGKALAKFAQICLTIHDVLGKDASSCVSELETNIATFINNQNIYPIVYDTVWKGAISSCGDSGCDFGNAWYNDHHFHYGYFVYTAAVIAHLDASWLTAKNKAYINTLVRDFANPSTSDTAFPQFRSFDWAAGHSWAHGITASADGKDEESSSEDYNAVYGMKLWGKVIGDASMEARGNLMLAVMRRSMQSYMLMASNNAIEPSQFVPQYAAGITFMNKVDHTTYFGQNEQYIQGIHMIPLTPISAYIRSPTFVAEEWSAVIQPILSSVTDGWLGILMANLAISNSTAAYDFFSSPSFSNAYLDGGASLTWYLTYSAGLGGAGNLVSKSQSSSVSLSQSSTSAPASSSSTVASSSASSSASKTSSATTAVSGTAINVASFSPSPLTSSSSALSSMSLQSSSSASNASISTVGSLSAAASSNTSATAPLPVSSVFSPSSSVFPSSIGSVSTSSASTIPTSVSLSLTSSSPGSSSSFPSSSSLAAAPSSSADSPLSSPSEASLASITNPSSVASSLEGGSPTSSMPAGPTQSSASVKLTLDDGRMISCQNGSLVLSNYADVITIFANGTLSCKNLAAFLIAETVVKIVSTIYDIDLLAAAPLDATLSTFALVGTNLVAYAEVPAHQKRQTSTATAQALKFVYGSDDIVRAIPITQNTTMTVIQPQVMAVIVPTASAGTSSGAVTSNSLLQATSSDTVNAVSSSVASTASSVFSTANVSAFTNATSTSAGSSPTTTSSTTTALTMTTSTTLHLVASAVGAASVQQSASSGTNLSSIVMSTALATGAAVGAQASAPNPSFSASTLTTLTVVASPTATVVSVLTTESTTLSYTITVDGQLAVATTVVPVKTVELTSTYTTTVCSQCVAETTTQTSAPVEAAADNMSPSTSTSIAAPATSGDTSAGTPAAGAAVGAVPNASPSDAAPAVAADTSSTSSTPTAPASETSTLASSASGSSTSGSSSSGSSSSGSSSSGSSDSDSSTSGSSSSGSSGTASSGTNSDSGSPASGSSTSATVSDSSDAGSSVAGSAGVAAVAGSTGSTSNAATPTSSSSSSSSSNASSSSSSNVLPIVSALPASTGASSRLTSSLAGLFGATALVVMCF